MPSIEADRAKVVRRLESEGWVLDRHGAQHDIYKTPAVATPISVPRHRTLSPGVARQIARATGWI